MIVIATTLRMLLMVPLTFVWTMVLSVFVILVSLCGQVKMANWISWIWSAVVLRSFGVRVQVTGENFLPKDGAPGALLLFNHQSFFDIFALYGTLKITARFGAKAELFKIPFFGPAMAIMGTLQIDRGKRAEVMRIYQEAQVRFAQGFSFMLAPEGTRQPQPEIGPFKRGPFLFAIGAQAPIIPAVIYGTHAILPKNSFVVNVGVWRRTIYLQYLEPIPTAGITADDVPQLIDRVRAKMLEAYAVHARRAL